MQLSLLLACKDELACKYVGAPSHGPCRLH
jgi:hypothetical protein